MKQIIINVNPHKRFDEEMEKLIPLQIDNSLELGWKTEDIVLVTNFNYEYCGVKSILVPDSTFCEYNPVSTKVPVMLHLFKSGLIGDGMYWVHDPDAFQLVPITEEEIGLDVDMALCDYGRMPKWEGGSVFIKKESKDIWERQMAQMYQDKSVDEDALFKLTNQDEELSRRIKKLNISYSFKPFNIRSCFKLAIKPIRVAHFHPLRGRSKLGIPKLLDFFKGKNKINEQLIPDRLIVLFNKYQII